MKDSASNTFASYFVVGLIVFISCIRANGEMKDCANIMEHLSHNDQMLAQTDFRLVDSGLATEKENNLCGPTCAWNLMNVLEKAIGDAFPRHRGPVKEFINFRQSNQNKIGVLSGVLWRDLYKYLESKITKANLPFEMGHLYSTIPRGNWKGLRIGDLDAPNRVAIVSIHVEYYSPGSNGIYGSPFVSGSSHYVIVQKIDRLTHKFTVNDPADGKERIFWYSEHTNDYGYEMLRLDFDQPAKKFDEEKRHVVLEDIIFLDHTKDPTAQRIKTTKGFDPDRETLKSYVEATNREDEINNFWDHHPNYGIIKVEGRFLLVTRDRTENILIQKGLLNLQGRSGELPRISFNRLSTSYVTDITDILPEIVRSTHSTFSEANCWGAAIFIEGMAKSLENLDATSFHSLITGPNFQKLSQNEKPELGDVLAFRDTKFSGQRAEVHAAVFVTDKLWLSKTDWNPGFIKAQDPREVKYVYGPVYERLKGSYPYIEVYRPIK